MIPSPSTWSLTLSIFLLLGCGLVIAVCGVMLTARAQTLARISGLGQAIMGAVFLGITTSLAGTVTSVNAALSNAPELAVGNAVGGIAAQTTFLVLADMFYRGSNLEHAAASSQNLFQAVLLIIMLAIALLASAGPGYTVWQVDYFSFILLASYGGGMYLVSSSRDNSMWIPRSTPLTEIEPKEGENDKQQNVLVLWSSFVGLAAIVAVAGWVTSHAGINISEKSGLSQTIVGTLFTSVATSIPELVIALTAVRRGAVTLAVGDIIGGNSFDVLFLVASDIAYRSGSIYQAVSQQQTFWLAMNILLASVLLLGLLKRQRHGSGNIGFEGVVVLGCYFSAVVLLFMTEQMGG